MSHAPASALASGLAAFHNGIMQNRMRQAAYDAAVAEGRRQDALNRRIRSLELALLHERARNDEAAVQARVAAILGRLKG